MRRPDAPPSMEFFNRARPACGNSEFPLRMGDVGVALLGLAPELAKSLSARFSSFCDPSSSSGSLLQVAVARDEVDYFIQPPRGTQLNRVLLTCDGHRIRYLGHQVAGWFDARAGHGSLVLAQGTYERPERAVENYLRAAVAWQAAERGGALVHAASAVLEGRGYLFLGPSGAGKSTLSACSRRGRVVSDDLSLVLPGPDGRAELVGSPFRGTYEDGAPVVGRFPIAAGFRIIQNSAAVVRPTPRVRALCELVGNLPFVAEAFGKRPDLFESIERTFDGVPLAHLHFRKDDSYWEAILKWQGTSAS